MFPALPEPQVPASPSCIKPLRLCRPPSPLLHPLPPASFWSSRALARAVDESPCCVGCLIHSAEAQPPLGPSARTQLCAAWASSALPARPWPDVSSPNQPSSPQFQPAYVFFCVLRFVQLSRDCQFYRKTPHVHAYNNSTTVHRIEMFSTCKVLRISSSFIICHFHPMLKLFKMLFD